MQVKLLRQAAGRDDRIVAAYEDVTFLNEHVGWYPIIKDRFRKANDIVVVVLRVGDVCFEAGSMFRRRNAPKDISKRGLRKLATCEPPCNAVWRAASGFRRLTWQPTKHWVGMPGR